MKRKFILGILLGVMAAGSYGNESDGIFFCKVGQFEVYMLVESQRSGNAGILTGADEATMAALLARYIPAGGFNHSANAFLVKTPEKIILVDTGTGTGGIILEKMKKLGVEPDQVDAVLITHLHGDHFGSLQKDGRAVFTKAKIYLSFREREYWTKTNVNQGAAAALAPYGSRVETFEPVHLGGAFRELFPGITPIAAYGHTPGHTIFLVENSGDKLLIIGDLLHVALVQFPVPEISATYDSDPQTSAVIRRQVLDYAAKNRIPVGGMHIVFPGMGTVEAAGEGFRFLPAD
ncbi:MAG: MBL fold metallo-hydrolase [Treponema sp.]|nr:MBL fold metallo-hydrolase [Treponema sp.]